MEYELVVVGLGAFGSSVLYNFSKFSNNKICGIDMYCPPHSFGSSHGESRLTRLATAEGNLYSKLARRSQELCSILESDSGEKHGSIYNKSGGIIIGNNQISEGFLNKTINIAKLNGISYKLLNYNDLKSMTNLINFSQDHIGYFEHTMGIISPEKLIIAQLNLARNNGAEIFFNEKLLSYSKHDDNYVRIKTNIRNLRTKKLVIACGAWVPNIVKNGLDKIITIYRQTMLWYKVEDAYIKQYKALNVPIIICDEQAKILVFPMCSFSNTIKISVEDYSKSVDIESKIEPVSDMEKSYIYMEYIKKYFYGISAECTRAETCLYSATQNQKFAIDFIPGFDKSVFFLSACSGHGFKHSLAIGEAIAKTLIGQENPFDVLKAFSIKCYSKS